MCVYIYIYVYIYIIVIFLIGYLLALFKKNLVLFIGSYDMIY